ncbi:MAG: bacillithiol biosynthesis cysteine-adding enzyme BshC [Cryomorphaceae bacterium]|nr:MAG: bacillithiol biosynthesis cysteine-adding enzyme BshC [Cryomorphaceae bacterium]
MFKVKLSYRETGRFSDLVHDYLEGHVNLRPFYHRAPDIEGMLGQADEKLNDFKHRQVLVDALSSQYTNTGLRVPELVHRLAKKNCVTVTTGHQLCLFSGPLYFVYKILTTIRLSEELNAARNVLDVVPVFWMASEDHDFDEVNHCYVNNQKIEWESGQAGAVGRMKLEGMEEVLGAMKEALGEAPDREEVMEILRRTYGNSGQTLATATRQLVAELFGLEKILIIDGDDASLKQLFAPHIEKEINEQFSFRAVSATSGKLAGHYKVQVHPRELNLFYLDHQLRERIVATSDGFEVLHTDLKFSKNELLELVHNHPERFSPNVILRPLYQETILPNVCYVGGGGELAYWFQLKDTFRAAGLPFPVLLLRNSSMWVSAADMRNIRKLNLDVTDFFGDSERLIQAFVREQADEDLDMSSEYNQLEALYEQLSSLAASVDPTLEKMVMAEGARTHKGLKFIEKRIIRAAKRKNRQTIDRIQALFDRFFPNNGLQERHDNYFQYHAQYGSPWLEQISSMLEPLEKTFTIVVDNHSPSE